MLLPFAVVTNCVEKVGRFQFRQEMARAHYVQLILTSPPLKLEHVETVTDFRFPHLPEATKEALLMISNDIKYSPCRTNRALFPVDTANYSLESLRRL